MNSKVIELESIRMTDKDGLLNITSTYLSGARFSLADSRKDQRYYTCMDLFGLGNSYADRKFEAFQINNRDNGDWTIRSLANDGGGGSIHMSSTTSLVLETPKLKLCGSKASVTLEIDSVVEDYTLKLPQRLPLQPSYLTCDQYGTLTWKTIQ